MTSSSFVDANPHALHWKKAVEVEGVGVEWTGVTFFGVIFSKTDEGLSRKKYARSFSL